MASLPPIELRDGWDLYLKNQITEDVALWVWWSVLYKNASFYATQEEWGEESDMIGEFVELAGLEGYRYSTVEEAMAAAEDWYHKYRVMERIAGA